MPESYISARVQGIPQGPNKTESKSAREVDEESSYIYARYQPLTEGTMLRRQQYSLSNNQSTIGYTAEGLPFLILATNSKNNNDSHELFSFIDEHINPLVEDLSNDLAELSTVNEQSIEPLLLKFINDIFSFREEYEKNKRLGEQKNANEKNEKLEFMLSLAVTFSNRNKKYCLGLGLGNNGIVLFDGEQTHQLVSRTQIDSTALAFDSQTASKDRTKIFQGMSANLFEVSSNVTLTAYTEIPTLEDEHKDEDLEVNRFSLKPDIKSTEMLVQQSEKKSDAPQHVDLMIASVKIPDARVQNRIQDHLFKENNNSLGRKLQSLNEANPLKAKGEQIQQKVFQLMVLPNPPASALIRSLSRVNHVLENNSPQSVKKCKDIAKQLKGKPSLALKSLGGLLMLFGAAAIGVGLLLTPTLAGIPLVKGGGVMFVLGAGLFQTGRRGNISKTVYGFANSVPTEKNAEERNEEVDRLVVRVRKN